LRTDIGWIRQHTAFGEAAQRWHSAGQSSGLLLRPPLLEEAERWIASRPPGAPAPTEETQRFVQQSRQATNRRRNVLTGSLAAGLLVALILAGIAYWQRGVAQEQRSVAEKNEALAKEQRDAALLTQSRFLADLAQQRLKMGDAGTAALLALEALPDAGSGIERPYAPDAEAALFGARRLVSTIRESFIFTCPSADQQAVTVAFSPDGRQLVTTCNHDNSARIWDAGTGHLITELAGHSAAVVSARFSPDGHQVATGSYDMTVRIWDVASAKTVKILQGHTGPLRSVAYSADGKRLVTTSSLDKTARIWDLETGEAVAVLGHAQFISDAAFSHDGTRVATAAQDGTRLWDAQSGAMTLTLEQQLASAIAFSPDGGLLAVSHPGAVGLTIWDLQTNQKVTDIPVPDLEKIGMSVTFSPEGRHVLVAVGNTARIWDVKSKQNILIFYGHSASVLGVAFNPRNPSIATASADGTARIWRLVHSSENVALQGSAYGTAAFSPDGRQVLSASGKDMAGLWDAASGALIRVFKGHTASVRHASFSPDGTRVATASLDHSARVWDTATGNQLQMLPGHAGKLTDIEFSPPDGKRLVTASEDQTARIWDAETGKLLVGLQGHTSQVMTAAFSPDGTRVVTASLDSEAQIWDAATGEAIASFTYGAGVPLYSAAFSPDGKQVLTSSTANEPRLWDVASGRSITLEHHGAADAAFSTDGKRIVTSSYDGSVRVWDVATGRAIAVIQTQDKVIQEVAFSPDGSHVMSASLGGGSRIWPIFKTTQALMDDVKPVLLHCLTRREREGSFLPAEPVGVSRCESGPTRQTNGSSG
jgi:WD40 repeat protein